MGYTLLLLIGLVASRRAMRVRTTVPELTPTEATPVQGTLPFDACRTLPCVDHVMPILPVFMCGTGVPGDPYIMFGGADEGSNGTVGVETFFHYLNGGPLAMAKDKQPQRPLLLGLEEEVLCPSKLSIMAGITGVRDKVKPPVMLWVALFDIATCFKVRLVNRHAANQYSTFCGCLSNLVRAGKPSKIETEKFIGYFPDECQFLLVRGSPKLRPLARPSHERRTTSGPNKSLLASALVKVTQPTPPLSLTKADVTPLAPALSLENLEESPALNQTLSDFLPTIDAERLSAEGPLMPSLRSVSGRPKTTDVKPSGPLISSKLCAATWNVGREWDALVTYGIGSGIGMSGLKGRELEEGLMTLFEECGDAGIIAVALQEGAAPEVTKLLREIDPRRSLVVSSFAGVQPWGDRMEDVPFLLEHSLDFGMPIKEGVLIKYGQLLSRSHDRRVVLTREHLLTFEVDTSDQLFAVGSPTNALRIDESFKVFRHEQTEDWVGRTVPPVPCFAVEGIETLRDRPAQVVRFKMCSKLQDSKGHLDILSWLRALNAETVEEQVGSPVRGEASEAYVLPFTQGVSLAIMSAVRPKQVKLYTVDFRFATADLGQPPKGEGLQAWMKNAARAKLPTTADKGATIVRVELHSATGNSRSLCLAACHLEATKRELRTRQLQLVAQSLARLECDATIWMGDFNTRPRSCCPWKEVEFAVAHELEDHVRSLTWSGDDLIDMMDGVDITYSEMQPLVRPTFHKRFKRDGHDECGELMNHTDVGTAFRANLVLNTHDDLLSMSKPALTRLTSSSLLMANAEALSDDGCGAPPSQSTLCWGGSTTRTACEAGRCFNTVDDTHCPGYTDRILFDPGTLLSPSGHYWPVESLIEADHTPVLATFNLDIP